MKKDSWALLLILLLSLTSLVFSQSKLLSFSPGARSLGLGRTGVVDINDPSALYWNPAILGALHSSQAIVAFHEPFLLSYSAYSHYFPLYGSFAVHTGKTHQGEDAIEFAGFGWGSQLGQHFYAGFSLNALQIGKEGWTTGGFGILFKPTWNPFTAQDSLRKSVLSSPLISDRLSLGLSVQNIPFVVSDYDHQIRLGASYSLTSYGPQIIYAYHFQRGQDTAHMGLVSSPLKNFKIFVGVQNFEPSQLAFGFEFSRDNLIVALAYDKVTDRLAVSTQFRIGPSEQSLAASAANRAKKLLQQGDRRGALMAGRRALAYDPKGQPEIARMVAQLDPAIKAENLHIDSLLAVAKAFEKKGWYINAAVNYMKILHLDPRNKNAEMALQLIRPKVNIYTEKLYQLGVKYFEKGDYKQARGIFESILFVRHDHQGSKSHLEQIDEIYRKQAEEHYFTGLGFYSQRNLDRAEEEFKTALQFLPNYSDAIEYLNRIKEDRKKNARKVSDLLSQAQSAEKRNQWLQALQKYRNVVQLDPDNARAKAKIIQLQRMINSIAAQQYSRGERAFKNGDIKTAQRAFRAVLSIRPGHAGARHYLTLISESTNDKAQRYMRLARDYFQNQKWESALAVLDSVLSISPNSASARELREKALSKISTEKILERAKSEYLSGQYLTALEKFNDVLQRDPNNPDALELREQCQIRLNELVDDYFNRGIQLYTEEKYKEAIAEWEKVLNINPYHKGALEYKKKAKERLQALGRLP